MQCNVCVKVDFYQVLFACSNDSHLLALEYIIDCYQSAMCVCVGVSINCKGNFKKLSANLTQHFLNFIKLPNLFNFDTILRDLWPVECKRSSFETPLKMQNL